jgi:Tol biopolymer transport system component
MKNMRAGAFLMGVLLAGLLAASLAVAQKNTQGEILMQAANHKQVVEGQLEDAIQIYKRIAQEHASDRALVAKALVQMGQCYEKLGKTEARNAYERVLREYSDQSEAADAARKRLFALGESTAKSNGPGMTVRRVWAGNGYYYGLFFGNPSPDGRFVSFVDGTTGNLALHEFATGKNLHLISKSADETPVFSAISPDGREVAFCTFGKGGVNLRIARLDGSASRILYKNKTKAPVGWPTWSPDGKSLLCIIVNPRGQSQVTAQIAVVSVADGSVRILKTLDGVFPGKAWFSPDGRYIAYDYAPRQDSETRDIFLLSADGNREVPLVQHPADDLLLGWTPDSNHILFASDRSGSTSVWMQRVADGKAQGPPELVKQDIGQAVPLGFTPSGSFYYCLEISMRDIYSADFDPTTGRIVGQPQRATQRSMGSNTSPEWSPDGQFLAYRSSRPGPQALIGERPIGISIRSLKTGEERDFPPTLLDSWGPLRWSLDGRSLFVTGKDKKLNHGVFRIDAQSGEVTLALQPDSGSEISYPAWLPDGKRLLYVNSNWREDSGAASQSIVLRELDTGRTTELYHSGRGVTIDDVALSPDGQQVALTLIEKEKRSSTLKVLPVAGGEASELVRATEPETIVGDSLSWSSDSHSIIFGKGRTTGEEPKIELQVISARGGEPHALGLSMDYVHNVSFHPDGRHLAFAASTGKDKVEIWVMENFLPKFKPVK